jgi:hypothetical protein
MMIKSLLLALMIGCGGAQVGVASHAVVAAGDGAECDANSVKCVEGNGACPEGYAKGKADLCDQQHQRTCCKVGPKADRPPGP